MVVHGRRWSAYGATETEAALNLEEKVHGFQTQADHTSLRSWMETAYCQTLAKASAKQQEKAKWAAGHLGALGDLPLAEVNRHALQRLVNSKSLSAGTIRTMASCWSAALNLAEADGLIPHNPMRHVRLPSDPPAAKATLSAEELRRLIEASRGYSGLPLVVLGGLLGLRIGEVQRLEAGHFADGELQVPGTKTVAAARTLPLPRRVHQELAGLPLPLLSPCQSANRNALLRNAKRAGIERRVHPHLLRHTCLTLLQWIGCPYETRARIAGHSLRHVTQRYSHAEWRAMEEWLTKLSTFVYTSKGNGVGNGSEMLSGPKG